MKNKTERKVPEEFIRMKKTPTPISEVIRSAEKLKVLEEEAKRERLPSGRIFPMTPHFAPYLKKPCYFPELDNNELGLVLNELYTEIGKLKERVQELEDGNCSTNGH